MSIEDKELYISPGKTVEIPVSVAGNTGLDSISTCFYTQENDTDFTLKEVKAGIISPAFNNGKITWSGDPITEDGTLFTAVFEVSEDAKENSEHVITFKPEEISLDGTSVFDQELSTTVKVVAGEQVVAFRNMIAALPATITEADAEQVKAVADAYAALTAAQKAMISADDIAILDNAQSAVKTFEDIAALEGTITTLPSYDQLTLSDKETVAAARAAYDALDDAAKAKVTNYQSLVLAEKSLEVLEAQAELAKEKEAYDALKAEADKAKEDLDKAKEDLNTLQSESETTKKDLEDAKTELESAKKDLEDTKTELEDAKKDLEDAKAEVESAKKDLEDAKAEAEATAKDLEDTKTDAEAAKQELEKAKAETAKVKKQLATTKAKNRTVSGLKLSSKSKKLTATWKKTTGATGYQVAYKLKTAKKYTTLKATTKLKKVTKKLKKGKVYQVKVRTYTKVNGTKVYGKWTSVKSIKCK